MMERLMNGRSRKIPHIPIVNVSVGSIFKP